MMRVLVVAFACAVGAIGCAADVDDPLPPPPPVEEQRNPPKKPLQTEFEDPFAQAFGSVRDVQLPPEVPVPAPDPFPLEPAP